MSVLRIATMLGRPRPRCSRATLLTTSRPWTSVIVSAPKCLCNAGAPRDRRGKGRARAIFWRLRPSRKSAMAGPGRRDGDSRGEDDW
jgi:hypothetical protein